MQLCFFLMIFKDITETGGTKSSTTLVPIRVKQTQGTTSKKALEQAPKKENQWRFSTLKIFFPLNMDLQQLTSVQSPCPQDELREMKKNNDPETMQSEYDDFSLFSFIAMKLKLFIDPPHHVPSLCQKLQGLVPQDCYPTLIHFNTSTT